MAKAKTRQKPELAKASGNTLIIPKCDPLGKYITRKTGMSLPATITKDIPGIEKIIKSYIVRTNGCNQTANAKAAGTFLTKNNLGAKNGNSND